MLMYLEGLLMLITAMLIYSEGLLFLIAVLMLSTVLMFTTVLMFLIYCLMCEVKVMNALFSGIQGVPSRTQNKKLDEENAIIFANYPTRRQAY
jgi:hypothetical protein